MNSLYHYCTVETLRCMLSNKTLRLSDIRKSNDPKEIDYLFDEYKKWNLKKSEFSNNAEQNNLVIEIDKKVQLKNETFLVLCLSKTYDTLSMWNRYASKGVAIEFDEEKLEQYLHLIRAGLSDDMIKENIPTTAEVLLMKPLEYYNDNTIHDYFNEKNFNGYDDFGKILDGTPFVKSDFYEDEQEIRIVYPHNYNTNILLNYLCLTDARGFHKEKVYFKSISSLSFQHKLVLDIPFPIELIKSITIGPDSTLTEKDIEEILFVNGVPEILIKKSRGTFR